MDKVRQGYVYWQEKKDKAGGELPNITRFDPVNVPHLLQNILLIGVEGVAENRRFKIRVMGSSIVDCYGFEGTNHYVEDCVEGQALEVLISTLVHIIETCEPILVRKMIPANDVGLTSCECIYLPYLCEKGEVGRILVVKDFHSGYRL